MSFEIEGKLHKKFETEVKGESFRVRDFVIETEGQYPQFVKFQLTQDRCSMMDQPEEGSRIKVYFDLRGREWQGKYFTNLNAWKIDAAEEGPGGGGDDPFGDVQFTDIPGEAGQNKEDIKAEDFSDDLPF